MAGLHTGTQQLHYHPYVPCLITAGGVSTDSSSWFPARNGFLFPLKALAKLTRGKLRAMLRRRRPDLVLLWNAWRKPWVVQITASGEGEQTVVDSLARSVFHLAITNARLVTLDDQAVTIRYKQRKSSVWLTCRICRRRVHAPLSSTWFTQRPSQGAVLRSVAPSQTRPRRPCPPPAGARSTRRTADRSRLAAKWLPQPDDDTPNPGAPQPPVCPHCHIGHLLLIRRLTPRNSMGP